MQAVVRPSNEQIAAAAAVDVEDVDTTRKDTDDRPPMLCRYDGHCPVRSTCAVSGPKDMRGRCEPIVVTTPPGGTSPLPPPDTTSTPCLVSCLKELQKDEHFFQEKWPVVDWTIASYPSEGRPDGCIIVYHRQADQISHWRHLEEQDRQVNWREAPPSIIDWTNERFHHVKRVDPYTDSLTDHKWMAFCTNPCTKDSHCTTTNDPPWGPNGFVCVDGACQRNPEYWGDALSINAVLTPNVASLATTTTTTNHNMAGRGTNQNTTAHTAAAAASASASTLISVASAPAEMVLVTGATSSYYRGLMNLAASARYWAPRHKLVVYNLGGLNAQHLAEIKNWSNVLSVEWPHGVPEHYPNHVQEGKKYAWKPIIINETVHKYKSIFWMDAGSTLAGPVEPIEKILRIQGIMLVKGQDLNMRLSHPGTYTWFGYDKETMATGPHYSGNTQAFLHPSRYTEKIVIPNAKCALDVNCIAPPGSALHRHRYDQTSISILAYAPKTQLPHYTEYLAAQVTQLNPDLSKPSFKLVWTARQACSFYATNEDKLMKGRYDRLQKDPVPVSRRIQAVGPLGKVSVAVTRLGTDGDHPNQQPPRVVAAAAAKVNISWMDPDARQEEFKELRELLRRGGDPLQFFEKLRQEHLHHHH